MALAGFNEWHRKRCGYCNGDEPADVGLLDRPSNDDGKDRLVFAMCRRGCTRYDREAVERSNRAVPVTDLEMMGMKTESIAKLDRQR